MQYHQGEPVHNVGDIVTMGADRFGDKMAFAFQGDELSYSDLDSQANQIANRLSDDGLEPGDRVGLFLPNELLFPPAYYGTIKAGGIPVPLNLRMDPETLAFVIQDSGTQRIIGSMFLAEEATNLAAAAGVETLYLPGGGEAGSADVVDLFDTFATASDDFATVERDLDDVACQPYTSGTTGQPKGVLLTHDNLLSTIESYNQAGLPVGADDSVLLVLPLFHIYALNAIMGSYLTTGAAMYLQPQPEGEPMLRAIDDNDITKFAGVPAMYTMMWRVYREEPDEFDLSSLEDVICAAAPLADEVRKTIEKEWDVPMIEGWGMTETAPAGTLEPVRGVKKSAGSTGPTVPDIELKIVDPATRETLIGPSELNPRPSEDVDWDDKAATTGEIAVRGPQVFEGYYNRPDKNEEVFDDEGWFYTDDIARIDGDAYVWMVDRADDMMIVGGENVYPAEVEDALYEHPAVEEAAVVAAPHEVKGEAPVAFVVLEAGADVTEDEIRSFALERVPTYAHPRRVFFVDELPRSATQKVQRFKLEDDAESRLGQPLEPSEGDL